MLRLLDTLTAKEIKSLESRHIQWYSKTLLIGALLCVPLTSVAYDPSNCWSYITERIGQRIPAKELIANITPIPQVGSIAVMRYEKQGLNHFGFVEVITDSHILISETNYKKGEFGYRFLSLDYQNLRGFYVVQ